MSNVLRDRIVSEFLESAWREADSFRRRAILQSIEQFCETESLTRDVNESLRDALEHARSVQAELDCVSSDLRAAIREIEDCIESLVAASGD